MEKKSNGLIIIIILLIISVIGLLGYIIYDKNIYNTKTEQNNENNLEQNNENNLELEEKEEVDEYNYTEISNILNQNLSGFLGKAYDKHNINLLSVTDLRIGLVNYLLRNDANDIYDGQAKSIGYDKYNNKYNELYGTSYSLETDLANVSSAVAKKNITENTILWNATGTSGLTYNLIAQNITVENEVYTLAGVYTKTDVNNNGLVSNGTFTIKYVKIGNIKNIQSIVLS